MQLPTKRCATLAKPIQSTISLTFSTEKELVIGRMDRNSDQVVRFLDNPEVREFVTSLMRN